MGKKYKKVILTNFLTDVCNKLQEGIYPSKIAKEMGFSKPRIHYWIKKLLYMGIIEKAPESEKYCHFYNVKIQSTPIRAFLENRYVRPHNYAIKFRIIKEGLPFPEKGPVGKRYWSKQFERSYEDVIFEKTTKHIIAYLKRPMSAIVKTPDDLDSLKIKIHHIITETTHMLCEKYGMEVDFENPVISRREIEVKDNVLDKIPKEIRIRNDIFKKVYPDKVEFKDELTVKNYIKNRALEDLSPELVKTLQTLFEVQQTNAEIQHKYAEAIEKHLSVLNSMDITLKHIRDSLYARQRRETKKRERKERKLSSFTK